MVLVGALLTTGCEGGGDAQPPGTEQAVTVKNTTDPLATGAAKYLPDFSAASFPIEDVDLAAKAEPMKRAVGLLGAAIGEPAAPRFEVQGIEASTSGAQVDRTQALTRSALACLHQRGAEELHAYYDTRYRYSMSVALVVKARAYRNLDPAWCAITSVIPYQDTPEPGRDTPPTIAPCVGERREGTALVLWVGTTDTMCAALGDQLAPVGRTLFRGDSGTDVARLQLALNDLGSDLRIDGRMGAATISAIRAFQDCYAPGSRRRGIADAGTLIDLSTAQTSGWSPELCAS